MEELYSKLSKYTLKDALNFESNDRQFIALKKLEKNISDKELYFLLTILNSIICYQLSWKGEDYWEEFSEYFSNIELNKTNLISNLWIFISNSKNNKRFVDTKIKRLNKLSDFILDFYWKSEYFYENMIELRDILSKIMNQKKDAKTIVFAIKMFWYSARNIYDFVEYPFEISIPIDSRLTALFEKYRGDPWSYNWDYDDIKKFYFDLSKKLNISQLHLDALVWVNYDILIK